MSYEKLGIGLMWMPAHTTVPPRATARKAAGTNGPTGAKMIAASTPRRSAAVIVTSAAISGVRQISSSEWCLRTAMYSGI